MNEGVVDGTHNVECPECNQNRWEVRVSHWQEGPGVDLYCVGPEGGDCWWSIHISIGQSMELI